MGASDFDCCACVVASMGLRRCLGHNAFEAFVTSMKHEWDRMFFVGEGASVTLFPHAQPSNGNIRVRLAPTLWAAYALLCVNRLSSENASLYTERCA